MRQTPLCLFTVLPAVISGMGVIGGMFTPRFAGRSNQKHRKPIGQRHYH
jgi:hypothetical protein